MTLSINNEFDWEGIQVKVSLPSTYDPNQTYPAILLNDGNLDFLSSLSESVILVGLTSKNRLDDYTPWKASALRDGAQDFGGQANAYHGCLFGGLLDKLRSLYRVDKDRLAYGGYSLGGLAAVYSLFSFDKVSCVFSICGSFWYPDFTTYCREEKVRNLDCLLYLQNGQTEEPIIPIAWLKHQSTLSRSIPAFRNTIRLVSLSLIPMGIMRKLLSDF